MQTLPAIIPQDKNQLEEEIKLVSGFANLIQVDICDGVFAPNKTWPYNGRDLEYFNSLKKEDTGWPEWEKVDVELHLMVEHPERVVEDWIKTGVSSIVAHIESTEHFQEVIDICKDRSVSIGLALKPSTDLSKLTPFIDQVDFLQVMGSDKIGHHGEKLTEEALSTLSALRERYKDAIIAIDIGVTEETAEKVIAAGANKLIVGGAIINAENPKKVFENLSNL